MRKHLHIVPTPLSGLALGIASLGLIWETVMPTGGVTVVTAALIAASLLFLVGMKFVHHPKLLLEDLAHPVVGSVVPTFAMALMVVSVSVGMLSSTLGVAVWFIAVLLHVSFLLVFCYHRGRLFELHHMVPSWFVPPVGIVVAAVTFPGGAFEPVAQVALYFGLATYAVLLPAMIYRLFFAAEIQDAAKPTIAIMAAPASLSLAGYLSLIEQPNMAVVAMLTCVALLMTTVIYLALFRLLQLPFSPGFAAFTFPLVIGATALFKLADWLALQGVATNFVDRVILLAQVELAVATVMVGYVALRYARHFLPTLLPTSLKVKS